MATILIDTSTDGAELVPAPPAGQFIRVKGINITGNGTVTATLKSNNSTTIWKSYSMADTTKGGIVANFEDLDCLPGQSLNLGLSAGTAVSGSLTYVIKGAPPS